MTKRKKKKWSKTRSCGAQRATPRGAAGDGGGGGGGGGMKSGMGWKLTSSSGRASGGAGPRGSTGSSTSMCRAS